MSVTLAMVMSAVGSHRDAASARIWPNGAWPSAHSTSVMSSACGRHSPGVRVQLQCNATRAASDGRLPRRCWKGLPRRSDCARASRTGGNAVARSSGQSPTAAQHAHRASVTQTCQRAGACTHCVHHEASLVLRHAAASLGGRNLSSGCRPRHILDSDTVVGDESDQRLPDLAQSTPRKSEHHTRASDPHTARTLSGFNTIGLACSGL